MDTPKIMDKNSPNGDKMTYELSKKLKDAGYKGTETTLWKGGKDMEYGEFLPFPTLSELIEACGAGFRELNHPGYRDGWMAMAYDNGLQILGSGETPEEAVIDLWLELNQNTPS